MKKVLLSLVVALFTFSAFAAEPLDCNGLKIATGPNGKGYSKLYANIRAVAGNSIQLCEINTKGGLENLTSLSTNESDVAIVPIDALKDMSSDENIAGLLAIMPLNSNFLHVLANSNGYTVEGEKKWGLLKGDPKLITITKFSDLKDKHVALVGTAQLMVRKLNKQLGYNMTFTDVDSDDKGFDMVLKGQAQAVMTISGWPSGTVGALKSDSGLTLVAYDAPTYSPYIVKNLNYAKLGVYNSPTLGVQNILVTRPFHGEKAADIVALRNTIAKNLVRLQDGNFEPGWKEIKNVDAPIDWNRLSVPSGKIK